jgi:hypothetical protein
MIENKNELSTSMKNILITSGAHHPDCFIVFLFLLFLTAV